MGATHHSAVALGCCVDVVRSCDVTISQCMEPMNNPGISPSVLPLALPKVEVKYCTGILSQIGTKLRDWAVLQAGAGCYSEAAMSSNDSKTRYMF